MGKLEEHRRWWTTLSKRCGIICRSLPAHSSLLGANQLSSFLLQLIDSRRRRDRGAEERRGGKLKRDEGGPGVQQLHALLDTNVDIHMIIIMSSFFYFFFFSSTFWCVNHDWDQVSPGCNREGLAVRTPRANWQWRIAGPLSSSGLFQARGTRQKCVLIQRSCTCARRGMGPKLSPSSIKRNTTLAMHFLVNHAANLECSCTGCAASQCPTAWLGARRSPTAPCNCSRRHICSPMKR